MIGRREVLAVTGSIALAGGSGCLGVLGGGVPSDDAYVSEHGFLSETAEGVAIDPGAYLGDAGRMGGPGDFQISDAVVGGEGQYSAGFSTRGWANSNPVYPGATSQGLRIDTSIATGDPPHAYLLPPLPENASPTGRAFAFFDGAFRSETTEPMIVETGVGHGRTLEPTKIADGVYVDEFDVESLEPYYFAHSHRTVMVGDVTEDDTGRFSDEDSGVGVQITG